MIGPMMCLGGYLYRHKAHPFVVPHALYILSVSQSFGQFVREQPTTAWLCCFSSLYCPPRRLHCRLLGIFIALLTPWRSGRFMVSRVHPFRSNSRLLRVFIAHWVQHSLLQLAGFHWNLAFQLFLVTLFYRRHTNRRLTPWGFPEQDTTAT